MKNTQAVSGSHDAVNAQSVSGAHDTANAHSVSGTHDDASKTDSVFSASDKTEGKRQSYHERMDVHNTLALREVLATLPRFAKAYFRAIEPVTSTRTRLSYAYDIRTFFRYLQDSNPCFARKDIVEWSVEMLDLITASDIEEYQEFLKVYDIDKKMTGASREVSQVTNGERGLKRKMSALRSFYAYYFKRQMIKTNQTLLVDMPKLHEKAIIRLDEGETAALLDYIEHGGDRLSGQKKRYYEKTKVRDLAIVTLLLGTGIRVSECVGLDIQDIDFRNNGIRVVRKGGSEMIVYFGREVEKALRDYIEFRKGITPVPGHENALFYSSQKKRMNVKSVENMVKKYASAITTTKKITPHKLRSTFGTALYRETGDIYLVADVLGHSDVNTTKKHYAAINEENRKAVANKVILRQENSENNE
jgi:site-specific recombinase XerD